MKKIAMFLFLVMTLIACKKSVEGETATWEANKVKLKKLRASYPNFATLLDKELKNAEAKWKEAQKIGNEEEKIKKMAEANYTFNQGLVYELSMVETKMENLDQKSKELSKSITAKNVSLSNSQLKTVLDANNEAKDVLLKVEKLLNKKDVISEDKAYLSLKEANKSLTDAQASLDEALRVINQSKVTPKTTKDSTKTSKKKKTTEVSKN